MTADVTRDVRHVLGVGAPLDAFNTAGILAPADVHAARTYGRLAGEGRGEVLLAAALAVRAPRLQHVCVDLDRVRDTVTVDDGEPTDVDALPWPDPPAGWRATLAASPLVADGPEAPDRPLRLVGRRLYLDRYWRYERQVLADLTARADAQAATVDAAALRSGLDRLFGPPGGGDLQRIAAAAAVLGRLAVIAGGPGTGKTHTVSRVLALLAEQAHASGEALPRVALAAPTGKAAQRMEEALVAAVHDLEVDAAVRAWLLGVEGTTIHRLLGRRFGSRTRFRHDAANPLPHALVVVDESSMASLSLFAKLLAAVRHDARLVLVGDPEQLASVEAGSVLGDVVGPDRRPLRQRPAARRALAAATGEDLAHVPTGGDETADGARRIGPVADRVVVLQRGYRFRAGVAELAAAIQQGDADAACALLDGGRDDLRWIEPPAEDPFAAEEALAAVRARVRALGADLHDAARRGAAEDALAALDRFRVLCAHRRGPAGVSGWVPRIERWLAEDVHGFDPGAVWHVGRPVLVTRNDYQLGVLNGDVGITLARDGALAVALRKGEEIRYLAPTRLEHVETVHAMTVHKAQGSEFDEVVVVLPRADSPILSRELLYTAVTRARRALTVVGGADAVRAAVARRVQRASGLREALWGA